MSKANIMDHPHSPIYNIVHYIVLYLYNKPNSTTEVADCLLSMEVSDDDDELVILLCTNTDPIETTETLNDEILVSNTDILAWDLPMILTFPAIKVQAHRNRFVTFLPYIRFSHSIQFCLIVG